MKIVSQVLHHALKAVHESTQKRAVLIRGPGMYRRLLNRYDFDLSRLSVFTLRQTNRQHAVQNAAPIASLLLTTEAVVAEAPEKKEKGAGAGMSGPDMDY